MISLKYKSAKKILPEKLMKEVQEYIQGEYLYIPKAEGSHKKWGECSGYRRELSIRNDNIRKKFKDNHSLNDLAEEYALSIETIKKIVYVKNK